MNKKVLTIIFAMCLLVMLLLYIGAEENLTNPEDSVTNQEGNVLPQNDITNVIYENLDSLNSENYSNISDETTNNTNITNTTIEDTSSINIPLTETNETNTNITSSNDRTINSPEANGDEGSVPQESSSLNSGYYSLSSSEGNSEYTDISNIIQNSGQNNSENISVPSREKTNYTYYLRGKKEIDIGDYNGSGITKSEVEKSEYEKEVTVSSEEHFEGYLRVYTSLATEAKKEDIKIYWKNNDNLEITGNDDYAVEYYDENNNGLIDRVSWTVPHLSEQTFEVVIGTNFSQEIGKSQIDLIVQSPLNTTNNPINFKINTTYNNGSFVNCSLEINQSSSNTRVFFEYFAGENNTLGAPNLQNGTYNWEIQCWDNSSPSINNFSVGNFVINENFSVSLTGGNLSSTTGSMLYFLDLVKNDLKYNGTINIHSETPSKVRIELKRGATIQYTNDIPMNIINYSLNLNKNILNQSGIYTLTVYFDKPSAKYNTSIIFSVASANLSFNQTSISEGQSVIINTNINSPLEKVQIYEINQGDSNIVPVWDYGNTGSITRMVNQVYNHYGLKTVTLKVIFSDFNFTVQKNGISVTSNIDNINPLITLLGPEHNEIIYEGSVNFSYKATDNINLQKCIFQLYNNPYTICTVGGSKNLIYTSTKEPILNNTKIWVNLTNFTEGNYGWDVECYDNSSNNNDDFRCFEVTLNGISIASLSTTTNSNYTQKAEVDSLKKQAETFINKDFSLEEREALDDLNILNDTRYYQKRLIALDISLASNFSASTSDLRNKKIADALAELEDIKNRMPQGIVVKDNYEYVKNSVDSDLEAIVQDYFSSTNTKIGKSSVQKLAKINKELQNEVSISAKIKNVEIEYENETQIITLVKKQIDLKNDSYTKILEVIPKNIAKNSDDVTFLTPNIVINKDPLFEINYEDLDKKEINYYIKGTAKLKDFEGTETLIFEDNLNKLNSGFTGFFIVDLTSGGNAIYIIISFVLLIILLFAAMFLFKKYRMISWRKEPNVVRVMDLIEEINKFLKEKEIEKARENYYKIKEIYPVLPSKTKAYFYEKINEMLVRIDKKDIFGLVKEYQEAKRNWNKEDYVRLYEDIKKIYGRLPEKDRKKVYDIINGY